MHDEFYSVELACDDHAMRMHEGEKSVGLSASSFWKLVSQSYIYSRYAVRWDHVTFLLPKQTIIIITCS